MENAEWSGVDLRAANEAPVRCLETWQHQKNQLRGRCHCRWRTSCQLSAQDLVLLWQLTELYSSVQQIAPGEHWVAAEARWRSLPRQKQQCCTARHSGEMHQCSEAWASWKCEILPRLVSPVSVGWVTQQSAPNEHWVAVEARWRGLPRQKLQCCTARHSGEMHQCAEAWAC